VITIVFLDDIQVAVTLKGQTDIHTHISLPLY